MNRSFTSHTTALSGSENPIVRHRHKVEPYVSPFILNAKRKAEERAKLARMKLKKKQSPVRNEWDQTPSNTGLFDPTIRKQEIFRLGPRNAEQPLAEQRPSSNRDQYDDENHPQRITRAIPTSHSKPQQQRSSALPPSSSSSTNRPHHYMTPRNEILPIHQASHSHSHSNPNDTQRQGKLTMKTTATTPNRAPVAYSNRQPQRQHNARSLLQQRPSQQPTPATATEHKPHRPNEIYTPYDHHEDLLYPKSPGQSLQGQSNIDSQQLSINPKVERSTSPVNETVAEMILKNEPQVKNVDQYHMLVPNESVGVMQQTPHKMTATAVMHHPQESLNAESNQPNLPNSMNNPIFRDPRYIETTEPLDRAQDMHGYYKQLIRERLKTLWQKHRGDPSEGEDDEIEGQPMRPRIPINRSKGKFKGIPFHAVPHGHDSQIYMRDMMASMAQIMTAVGEIVTSNAQSSHKDRRSKNRRRNGRSMSAATINDNVQFVPSTETNNFVLEMAQAMNPFAKQNLPKRKSEVIDLVLQKLQAIERCENDLRDFLAKPSAEQFPVSSTDDLQAIAEEAPTTLAVNQTNHDCASSDSPRATLRVPASHPDFKVIETFPKLVNFQDHGENKDIRQYIKEMDRVKQLKEIAFSRKNSTSQITGDNLANELYGRVLKSVADEFEELFDDYSQKFVNTV